MHRIAAKPLLMLFKRSVADHNKISAKKAVECHLAYGYTDEMITCFAIHSLVE